MACFCNCLVWSNFRSDVARRSNRPTRAMRWILEVEQAKRMAWIAAGDFKKLDSEIADCLMKNVHGDFRKDKKNTTKLQIHDGCKSLGWYIKISDMNGTFLDLSDVLKVQQENDNVQSSNTRCDETIVAMRTNWKHVFQTTRQC